MARFDAVDRGLPRRLSSDPDSKFYDAGAVGLSGRVAIILDGVELPEVVGWDADAGEVIRRRKYADGSLVLEGGVPEHELLRGIVEVRWIKAPAE